MTLIFYTQMFNLFHLHVYIILVLIGTNLSNLSNYKIYFMNVGQFSQFLTPPPCCWQDGGGVQNFEKWWRSLKSLFLWDLPIDCCTTCNWTNFAKTCPSAWNWHIVPKNTSINWINDTGLNSSKLLEKYFFISVKNKFC